MDDGCRDRLKIYGRHLEKDALAGTLRTDRSVIEMRSLATAPPPTQAVRGRPPRPGLREDIMAAAEEIFTERDYHEVQMDDVARASDVGKGTLYRHFRSKRELYLAVMFEGIGRLRGEIEAVTRMSDPPVQKLERIVRCTLGHFWDRRRFFALIHQNEHKPDRDVREWFRQRRRLVRLVQHAFDEAIAAGQVRAVDSRIATEMLFGMMRGVNRYRGRDDRLEALVTVIVRMLMDGVGTTAGRRVMRHGGER
jgi:AcrR family transcriptional regulator